MGASSGHSSRRLSLRFALLVCASDCLLCRIWASQEGQVASCPPVNIAFLFCKKNSVVRGHLNGRRLRYFTHSGASSIHLENGPPSRNFAPTSTEKKRITHQRLSPLLDALSNCHNYFGRGLKNPRESLIGPVGFFGSLSNLEGHWPFVSKWGPRFAPPGIYGNWEAAHSLHWFTFKRVSKEAQSMTFDTQSRSGYSLL